MLDDPDNVIHLPQVLAVEVSPAVRRLSQSGAIGSERAGQAIADLADLAAFAKTTSHCSYMWELRQNLTAYDAAYVALAEGSTLHCPRSTPRSPHAPGHDGSLCPTGDRGRLPSQR